MRRPLLALAAAFMALAVVTAVTVAVGLFAQRDGAPEHAMSGMMSSTRRMGPGQAPGAGMMHQSSVASEFEFLAEMVAHHEEAVSAAQELERSDRAEMREFGAAIVTTQSAQIEQMRGWLAQWYPDRPADVDYQPMMRDLAGLSGDELDEAFLQDMIGHHMMAVMMSQQLLVRGTADHEAVNDLARSIRDEQHAEIFQMRQWLAEWFDAGWRS